MPKSSFLWAIPGIAGGRPTLRNRGILTSVIYERWKAGETLQVISDDYNVDMVSVMIAVHYELGRRDRHKPQDWREAMES